ncbi:MAG: hypothetical protein AB7F89_00090 [Pirellulaceae bacterium]
MPFQVAITIPGYDPLEYTVADGRHRLGSDPKCELCVQFEEVAALAAIIEVRGEAVFLLNRNPFPIYVGEYELRTGEQGDWPAGQTVLLTTNVSLVLRDLKKADGPSVAQAAKQRARSTFQIAVVAAALALGVFLLATEEPAPDATRGLTFTFTDLVAELEDKPKPASPAGVRERRTVLNYLIDARVADLRWGHQDPRRALDAYEFLLDHASIRSAQGEGSTEQRIREFALARVGDLSARLRGMD